MGMWALAEKVGLAAARRKQKKSGGGRNWNALDTCVKLSKNKFNCLKYSIQKTTWPAEIQFLDRIQCKHSVTNAYMGVPSAKCLGPEVLLSQKCFGCWRVCTDLYNSVFLIQRSNLSLENPNPWCPDIQKVSYSEACHILDLEFRLFNLYLILLLAMETHQKNMANRINNPGLTVAHRDWSNHHRVCTRLH